MPRRFDLGLIRRVRTTGSPPPRDLSLTRPAPADNARPRRASIELEQDSLLRVFDGWFTRPCNLSEPTTCSVTYCGFSSTAGGRASVSVCQLRRHRLAAPLGRVAAAPIHARGPCRPDCLVPKYLPRELQQCINLITVNFRSPISWIDQYGTSSKCKCSPVRPVTRG